MKIYPLQMEDDLHKKLRLKSYKEGKSMKEVLIAAIEDYCSEPEEVKEEEVF